MTTWLLADVHGGADRDCDESLLALLELAACSNVDVWMLGDLFASWLGLDRFLTPFQRAVLDRFEGIRRAGGRVGFVVGNRDYLVEDQRGQAFDEVIEGEAVVPLGGRASLLAHGDRINPDDRLYHAWRGVSRSGLTESVLRRLPGPAARALSTAAEKVLAPTNKTYKTGRLPLPALERFSRRAKSEGAERAVIGHFHADRTLKFEGGADVVIAPAWLDQRRILICSDSGSLVSTNPLLRWSASEAVP